MALQQLVMAKELPKSNAPPDIWQLFNENRTFYFESDISSIPNPPCTQPAPTVTTSTRLHKSMSQPHMSVTGMVTSSTGEDMQNAVYLDMSTGIPIDNDLQLNEDKTDMI